MPSGCIEIDRSPLTLLTAASIDRCEVVGRRVLDALRSRLPHELAHACGRTLDETPALIFIERIEIDCSVGSDWADDAIARELGKRLAARLLRSIELGHGIQFRDRAEYVAAFLLALAEGEAWRQWCFDEFDGLKPLPASSALRAVAIDEGDTGRAALLRLNGDALRRVLHSLSDADAARLLAHLLADQSAGATTPAPATLLAALDAPPATELAGDPQRRLAWLISLWRHAPGCACTVAIDALTWLDTLHRTARAGRLHAVLDSDLHPSAMVVRCCSAASLDPPPVAGWLEADCALLIARLRQQTPPGPQPASEHSACGPIHSRYGGAWLLLLQLARLGWWSRWRQSLVSAGQESGQALATRLALAVSARALCGDRHAEAEADPTLRSALGLTDEPRHGEWTRGRRMLLARTVALPASASGDGAGVFLGAGRQRWMAWVAPPRGVIASLRPAGRTRVSRLRPDTALAAARAWWQAHDPLCRACSPLERALRLHALNLLREFASRLPGCAEASPGYLRSQCLALPACVTANADRIDVHLGRAPLDVLLSLAGTKRSEATLPDGRKLCLHAEQST